MRRNVELKARARDPARQAGLARALGASDGQVLVQEDTFFRVPAGRLKLRCLADGTGELIHYERPDAAAVKTSRYAVAPVEDPGSLKAVLTAALGVRGVVRKRRTLLRSGRTRIHLDEVDGLGSYLELEVVLEPGDSVAGGEQEARRLMAALDIRDDDLLDVAYIDLLERDSPPD